MARSSTSDQKAVIDDHKDDFNQDIVKVEESKLSAEGGGPEEAVSTIVTGSRLALIFRKAQISSEPTAIAYPPAVPS